VCQNTSPGTIATPSETREMLNAAKRAGGITKLCAEAQEVREAFRNRNNTNTNTNSNGSGIW
jgi:hypothetical protein